ncbi:MAG: ribulose-phosphate 3-epimerase, partial [Clostridia bacterium]|nr:ribulose-phosphate 3-epimerase [Clostridia bacterium]
GAFDLALVMTINPGFGGQKMLESCVQKVADVRRLLDETGTDAMIEVDGGVNETTAPKLVQNGATVLVAGSACFCAPDAAAFIRALHACKPM